MKHTLAICAAILLAMSAGGGLAQGLTPAECKQILQTYGVLPSACPTAGPSQQIAVQAPPLLAAPVSLDQPTQGMRENNIFFTRGGDSLTPEALLQLSRLADVLNSPTMSNSCIKLVGHSDSTGSELVNMEIGTKRAVAVRNRLALLLQNPARIEAVSSMGETRPLEGLPGRSKWQRRVEIWARTCPRF